MEAGLGKGKQFVSIPNFTVLPRCFESSGVGEAARGEGGVSELPEEEVATSLISTRLQPGVRYGHRDPNRFSGFHTRAQSR
jgi:hypothetical protein